MIGKAKPKVGDKAFLTYARCREGDNHWCVVSKVGRKYFYVKSGQIPEHHETRFGIEDWNHEYGDRGSFTYFLYDSETEYLETVMANKASDEIREMFNYCRSKKLTNQKIFAIADILDIELKKGDI